MDDLIDLVNILNKKRLSKIEIFDKSFLSNKNSLFSKLHDGIASGKIKNDEEASLYLYGTDKPTVKYRQLKSRFRKRALNTLTFLDLNDQVGKVPINKAFFELNQIRYINNILFKYNVKDLAIKLIVDNYYKALEFNNFNALLDFSSILITEYGIRENHKKFNEEVENILSYQESANVELLLNILYYKTNLFFKKHKNPKDYEIIRKEIDDHEKIIQNHQTFQNVYFMIRTNQTYYEHTGNAAKVMECCLMAEELFRKQSKHTLIRQRGIISIYKIKALIFQRKFEEGLIECKNAILLFEEGVVNWFILYEFKFLLEIKSQQLEKAKETLDFILKHSRYKKVGPVFSEKWIIFEGYLIFITQFNNNKEFNFNYFKFINNLPHYSQDKTGYNFAIRLLEVLFILGRGEYEKFIQLTDALKAYKSRYLKVKTMSQRSDIFLKIILSLEQTNFNTKIIEKKFKKELFKISNDNNRFDSDESEIIPYEDLWEIIKQIIVGNTM